MAISRGRPRQYSVKAGEERKVFLGEIAPILETDPAELDTGSNLIDRFGVDELEVFEFVQIAEDVWRVTLNPNPMQPDDFDAMVQRFPTLESMMAAAETAARRRDA